MAKVREVLAGFGEYTEPWPGRGVFNLSARSTIDAWPKVDADEVL